MGLDVAVGAGAGSVWALGLALALLYGQSCVVTGHASSIASHDHCEKSTVVLQSGRWSCIGSLVAPTIFAPFFFH